MAKAKLMEKIKTGVKGDKRLKIIVIIGIIGIMLLLASEIFSADTGSSSQNVSLTVDTRQYVEEIENELAEILSQIEGAGKCRVMVTVDCGVETVYATQEESSHDINGDSQSVESNVSYVVVGGSSGGKQALVIKEIQPKLRGIIIVCEGGGNSKVKMNVINAVSSAFDISTTKISVQKMK